MLQVILMWTGSVLAFGLLLVMALGPVIVEVDSMLHDREPRRAKREAASEAESRDDQSVQLARPENVHALPAVHTAA